MRNVVIPGDRVVVIAEKDEYFGQAGVFVHVTDDLRLLVLIDNTEWLVPFQPHDLELSNFSA